MNEKQRIQNFEGLISDERSTFLSESKEIIRNEEWLVASAGIIFMLLDFMEKQSPKMKKKELAEKLSVSPQYVGKLLRGEENLTLQTMMKIAHVMGMSLSELIGDLSDQISEEEPEPMHQFCQEEQFEKTTVIRSSYTEEFHVISPSMVQTIEYSNVSYCLSA